MGLTACDCDQQFARVRVGESCEETENNTNVAGATVPDPLPGATGDVPDAGDLFGSALAKTDDFDLPGVTLSETAVSVAVGAPGSGIGALAAGAVWLQNLNSEFDIAAQRVIARNRGDFSGTLSAGDRFGSAVATYSDLNSDQLGELLVGAPGDDEDGDDRGAVWLLIMNSDGSVSDQRRLRVSGLSSIGPDDDDQLGTALAVVDFNRDDISEIVVGAPGSDEVDTDAGAIWVLSLDSTGFVDSGLPIAEGIVDVGGQRLSDGDRFGSAVASVRDLNGDEVDELLVGAPGDSVDGTNRGAVWILFMNQDNTVARSRRLGGDDPTSLLGLSNGDAFGSALTSISDSLSTGAVRIAVGAPGDDDAGPDSGAIWILDLDADGVLVGASKTTEDRNGFDGELDDGDRFGSALADLGDADDNGSTDLAVGAPREDGADNGSNDQGRYWVLFLN